MITGFCKVCGKPALKHRKFCLDHLHFGTVIKSNPQEICILYECPCQSEKTKNHHHPDPSQRYVVVKLCPSCHHMEHERLGSYGDRKTRYAAKRSQYWMKRRKLERAIDAIEWSGGDVRFEDLWANTNSKQEKGGEKNGEDRPANDPSHQGTN